MQHRRSISWHVEARLSLPWFLTIIDDHSMNGINENSNEVVVLITNRNSVG
jgi:hypothetical protein